MKVRSLFPLMALTLVVLTVFPFRLADEPAVKPVFKPPDEVTDHKPIEPPSRSGSVLLMEATAYSLEAVSGYGVTSTGTIPSEGRTIAVDPKVIPYGTQLSINGKTGYIAEDTGGDIKGNRIDVFMDNRAEALKFGRQVVKVQVLGR